MSDRNRLTFVTSCKYYCLQNVLDTIFKIIDTPACSTGIASSPKNACSRLSLSWYAQALSNLWPYNLRIFFHSTYIRLLVGILHLARDMKISRFQPHTIFPLNRLKVPNNMTFFSWLMLKVIILTLLRRTGEMFIRLVAIIELSLWQSFNFFSSLKPVWAALNSTLRNNWRKTFPRWLSCYD